MVFYFWMFRKGFARFIFESARLFSSRKAFLLPLQWYTSSLVHRTIHRYKATHIHTNHHGQPRIRRRISSLRLHTQYDDLLDLDFDPNPTNNCTNDETATVLASVENDTQPSGPLANLLLEQNAQAELLQWLQQQPQLVYDPNAFTSALTSILVQAPWQQQPPAAQAPGQPPREEEQPLKEWLLNHRNVYGKCSMPVAILMESSFELFMILSAVWKEIRNSDWYWLTRKNRVNVKSKTSQNASWPNQTSPLFLNPLLQSTSHLVGHTATMMERNIQMLPWHIKMTRMEQTIAESFKALSHFIATEK